METTAFLVWNRNDLLKKKCDKISLFVVMLKRYSFIIILNQAPNFQTGRSAFKPGGERQNQIQTGRTARLKRAGENPVCIIYFTPHLPVSHNSCTFI